MNLGIQTFALAVNGATIGPDALGVTGTVSISGNTTLGSSAQLGWSDAFMTRKGAANVQLGGADAASPVAQTLSVTDPALVAGVEFARDLYNEQNKSQKPLSSEEYILFVASSAAASYATQANETAKLASIGIAKMPQAYADRLAEFGNQK